MFTEDGGLTKEPNQFGTVSSELLKQFLKEISTHFAIDAAFLLSMGLNKDLMGFMNNSKRAYEETGSPKSGSFWFYPEWPSIRLKLETELFSTLQKTFHEL